MIIPLLLYTATIRSAIYIPAVKLGDGILDIASADANIQKQLREAVQNKTWPVDPLAKPKGISQLEWGQSILEELSREYTFVWSPPILWETFLACIQFERHDKSIPISEPYIDDGDSIWHIKNRALHDILIEKFSSIVIREPSRDEAMMSIEKDFFAFLGTTESFHDDPLWYSSKVRDLLKRIETAFHKLDGDCSWPKFRSLCDLWNALSEDIKRLHKGEKLMLELMAEMEHEAVIKDEYLIVRVTSGYSFYKGEDPKVPRALDWTRNFPGQRRPQVYEIAHEDYYENLDELKLTPRSTDADFTDYRRAKFSYGYTLLGGGWQEAWMPSGACCLAYAAYEDDNPITYVVRIPADEVEKLKLFMILPKFPLQLAYFGYGEFFHPRLGATHDGKMLSQYQTWMNMPKELVPTIENPLLSKKSLKLLGIESDDYVTAFNAAHNLINRYLADRSRIVGINHRLIVDENDRESLRILKYQKKLSDIDELERKVRAYENICKTAIFTTEMDSEVYPKAVAARIKAIKKRLAGYDSVFQKVGSLLEDHYTASSICSDMNLKRIAGRDLLVFICQRLPTKIEAESKLISSKAKIDCERLGIDPAVMYLMKGKWPKRE